MENQEIEICLKKTGYIKKIVHCKVYFQTGNRVEELKDHFKNASQVLPGEIRETMGIILRYIYAPLIIDDFTSHDDRKLWRDQVLFQQSTEACSFYKENKLRYSNTAYMLALPGLLAAINPRLKNELDQNIIQRANDLLERYPLATYQNLSLPETEKFVDEVAGLMIDLYLEIFRIWLVN